MAKKYRSLAKAEKEKEKEEDDDVKEGLDEVAPPGWEGTIKKMKGDKNIDNPWALAWWMKSKGYKPNANEEVWHREQKALEEDFVSNNMGSGNIQYRSPLLFSKKKQKLVKRKYPAGTMMAYEEVELGEEVADITIQKDVGKMKINQVALKVKENAKRFGLKSSLMGNNVRISGPKKKVNDYLAITIGRSSTGDATQKGPSNPQIDKMLTKGLKEEVELEEAAHANSVAGGNVNLDPHKKKKRINAKVKWEDFGGTRVYVVPNERWHASRLGKTRYARYEKYIGNDKLGETIRLYGRENPKSPIILKNEENGAMLYLKYGGSKRQW